MRVVIISFILILVVAVHAKKHHQEKTDEKPELLDFEKLKAAYREAHPPSDQSKPSVFQRKSRKLIPEPIDRVNTAPVTNDGRPPLTEFSSPTKRTKPLKPNNSKLQALANRTANVADRFGSAFTDVTDFTEVPYVVAIYSPSQDYFSGGGVAINTRWLLTTGDIGDEVATDYGYEYFVYQTIAYPSNTLPGTEKNRKIEENIIHPDYYVDDWTHNLALMKVCPPFVMAFFAIVPQPDTVFYTPNVPITTYIYYDGEQFAKTTQWFDYDSVCEFDMTNHYDASTHFCIDGLDSNNDIDIEDCWYCAIVVDYQGRVIGFGTEEGQFEWSLSAALMMENYYDWITTNAV